MSVSPVESLPDVIPLTFAERDLKSRLEAVVRTGFETFMLVGQALSEIRQRRLFRVEYPDFASYAKAEFGLALSSANGLIQHFQLAQNLIDDGVSLPPDLTHTAVKPLAGLPDEAGLRIVCWQFASSISPARSPSSILVSRLVRILRSELDEIEDPE